MISVAAFYRFTPIDAPGALKTQLAAALCPLGVRGTLLVAPEGINGTLAAEHDALMQAMALLRQIPGCEALTWKESRADKMPFGRLKVRLKKEIVTMGRPEVDPNAAVGRRIAPEAWNAVLDDPDTVVIDTRNDYEVAIGSFDGAIDPRTVSFGAFPRWWEENAEHFAGKRVAMFCTGGIRCEKSTSFLVGQGVEDVVHLDGGILAYLEKVPEAESRWHGGCFVFDERVAVGHGVEPTDHTLCHGCRRPLTPEDLSHPDYEEGVSCHRCAGETSEADKARYRDRQRQRAAAKTG
ncbi:rhodanese-related sulfurtransferase [Aestuariibius sp. 2305UL40-4]|uniref:oxygen-dependent tRNA uridine(34) hydroxylase TrhO n=1 Tax=Aestuariibius violaceus TaxID=3234132 RepID=UPI00345E473E